MLLKGKLALKKIYLVVDCRKINDSGIGTYLKNILPGVIDSEWFKITVLGNRKVLETFEWFNKVAFISVRSRPLSFSEQFELPFKIPYCNIYWAPNINGSLLPTRAKVRITTIHDVNHLANLKNFSILTVFLVRLLIKTGIFYSKNIITVSDFSKKEIIRLTSCQPDKVKVFYLAVSDNYNTGFTYSKINEPYILFVGNIKPGKNLENALKAFIQLSDKNLRFYIVGKKDGFVTGYDNINSAIANLGKKVFFTGTIGDEQLKNYYANAKAFVFPSKYEGFGLPVLEAMKFYIPILASNAASIPEVGGEAILYFNPSNVDEIREKIEMVLQPSFIVNKAKYTDQLNRFNWKKTVAEHVNLFKKVAESNSAY